MIRTLYPYPGPVDFGLLISELKSVGIDCLGANDVGGQVAVYTSETPDEDEVGAVVSAHGGPQPLPPSPLHLLAEAIISATSLDDLKPVAEQILDIYA